MNDLHETSVLPPAFCWTRFGTEAGEGIESILKRKEAERHANGGLFLWGIGNSVAPGLLTLLEECEAPEILFSPIRSRPRSLDVSPSKILVWTAGETLAGERYEIPDSICVTSGATDPATTRHYALVCRTEHPLEMADFGRLSFNGLRNISSGRLLGASQVTAVVRQSGERTTDGSDYVVALRASLAPPYFIRLQEAAPQGTALRAA